jgi:hypothetical protein
LGNASPLPQLDDAEANRPKDALVVHRRERGPCGPASNRGTQPPVDASIGA